MSILRFIQNLFSTPSPEWTVPESSAISPKERMEQLKLYFNRHSSENCAFEPEYEAASQVLAIVEKETLHKKDWDEIIRLYNETNTKPHYNGAGWFDFSMQIMTLLRQNGITHQVLPNRNIHLDDSLDMPGGNGVSS